MKEINKYLRSAVILAAGKSSRYIKGLDPNTNVADVSKCVCQFPLDKSGKSYLTPLTATMNACMASGIFDFHIVIGSGKSSVIAECDRINRIYGNKVKIRYVEVDPGYNRNLSIRKGLYSAASNGAQEVYLMNGDTLIAPKFIERMVDVPGGAILVRSKDFLEEPMEFSISKFNGVPTKIRPNNEDDKWYCCEVFKLTYDDCNKITPDYNGNEEDYGLLNGILADSDSTYHLVFAHPTDGIYDLNTVDDYKKIQHMLSVIE